MSVHRKTVNRRTVGSLSLLGICGLLAITVMQIPALVDLWNDIIDKSALTGNLANAGFDQNKAQEGFQRNLERISADSKDFESQMVTAAMMPQIQSELMEYARSCGCQLRKAAINGTTTMPWTGSLLQKNSVPSTEESQFVLSAEQIHLSLSGTLDQNLEFLNRVRKKPWLMRLARLNISRDSETEGSLNMEANLAFYKLARIPQADELIEWSEGPPAGDRLK